MIVIWKVIKWIFLPLLALVVLYVAFSFLLTYIPTGKEVAGNRETTKVYFFSNGVHLDFVFPLELIPTDLRSQFTYTESAKLMGIGWGDKGFYLDTETWADLKASVAIRAMFLPSATAMHVTEHPGVSSQWSYAEFTDAQLAEIWTHIRETFEYDADGKIIELVGEGYGDLDRFYEAEGNYSCFKTCNTWVNTGMKKIGYRTAVWTPLDKGVLRYLPLVSDPAPTED
ncbi:DUF2459 domain-containing protein [Neolewinella antarctica]|uniref:Uncharacterized protein (TIGR02117 family) n=1 Tax=Neolewinella antarctica TaxID=442734 RepID=A0ABX0XAF3_9BACT|nr:DUF2459 domain-containing protein [Neolewinella antarctica]NJC25933.1 uncharacterized protein (TIGR02117 family) [Neolewinella antarctica]